MTKCSFCEAVIPPEKIRCPVCKHWNIESAVNDSDDDTILLSDAIASNVDRVHTSFLDGVFGGGIVKTSVNLVAGPPGAGKTTLFLQLCDDFCKQFDTEALYIANEQDADEIKTTALRIKIEKLNKIRVVKAMGGLKKTLDEYLRKYKPCVLILDSLTKLVGDDPLLGCKVLEQLKLYTVELKCPSMVVNQINKEGDHAGIMKMQHAVDATFMLVVEDKARFFYSTKNRFGESPKGIELMMTPEDAEIPGRLIVKEEKKNGSDS